MSEPRSIYWDSGNTRIKGFTTANRGKSTVVRVEIEVTDPWELGDLVRQLQQAQQPRAAMAGAASPASPPRSKKEQG